MKPRYIGICNLILTPPAAREFESRCRHTICLGCFAYFLRRFSQKCVFVCVCVSTAVVCLVVPSIWTSIFGTLSRVGVPTGFCHTDRRDRSRRSTPCFFFFFRNTLITLFLLIMLLVWCSTAAAAVDYTCFLVCIILRNNIVFFTESHTTFFNFMATSS